MFDPTAMIGQWAGYFEYGPDYEELHGERVQFRLYIDDFIDGQFSGSAADLDGIGTNFEIAKVMGFVEDDFISFTKEYPHFYRFDENHNSVIDTTQTPPLIHYQGHFNRHANVFSGTWEIVLDIEPAGDGWRVEISTGKWEIYKDD